MTRLSIVNREAKREKTVKKYAAKRAELRKTILSTTVSLQERQEAQQQLQRLPRDASPCRLRNRCKITGRPHGYYRKFGLGRNKLRESAMQGFIPGLVKASW